MKIGNYWKQILAWTLCIVQVYENLDGQGCFDGVKEKIALALQEAEGL